MGAYDFFLSEAENKSLEVLCCVIFIFFIHIRMISYLYNFFIKNKEHLVEHPYPPLQAVLWKNSPTNEYILT